MNAKEIHFSLDGFRLDEGWQLGQNSDPYRDKLTDWEFARVLLSPTLRQKTIFWQNGRQIPLSRVLERAGIPPNGLPLHFKSGSVGAVSQFLRTASCAFIAFRHPASSGRSGHFTRLRRTVAYMALPQQSGNLKQTVASQAG